MKSGTRDIPFFLCFSVSLRTVFKFSLRKLVANQLASRYLFMNLTVNPTVIYYVIAPELSNPIFILLVIISLETLSWCTAIPERDFF